MDPLKLIALDTDDLEVISTHLQDAVVNVADIVWLRSEKRVVLALNRFDWEAASGDEPQYQRRRTALRFERVNGVKCRNVQPKDKDAVLNLLSVEFQPADAPGGRRCAHLRRRRRVAARGRVPGGRNRRSWPGLGHQALPGARGGAGLTFRRLPCGQAPHDEALFDAARSRAMTAFHADQDSPCRSGLIHAAPSSARALRRFSAPSAKRRRTSRPRCGRSSRT